jgi:hypothetical protein
VWTRKDESKTHVHRVVVAVVLSASRMIIATVQDLYASDHEPLALAHLTARIIGYSSNAFSAAVSILSHS